jgi:hypothetical protein
MLSDAALASPWTSSTKKPSDDMCLSKSMGDIPGFDLSQIARYVFASFLFLFVFDHVRAGIQSREQ